MDMDKLKFNTNGLWKAFSQTGNETLSISLYQGAASIVMFKKGSESRRPVVKMTLSIAACLKITDILKTLLDAQPESRQPFVQMAFNKENRTYEQTTSFVFFKDDKRCYGIEISNKFIPTPIKIMFRCPSTFASGSEPLTDEQKSILAVREFMTILTDQIPVAMLLSRFNMDPLPQRGGNGGGGGGQRSGGGNYQRRDNGGSRDPYGSSGSEEDSIFG